MTGSQLRGIDACRQLKQREWQELGRAFEGFGQRGLGTMLRYTCDQLLNFDETQVEEARPRPRRYAGMH